MTAKRFQYNVNKNCIECDGKFVAYVDMVDGFRIANKLTVLAEENEQLKSFKDRVFNLLANEIKEENELLDYYLKEKAPCYADRQQLIIGVLKRLQKELE